MNLFYVFQGQTYKEEHSGGFLWAPQKNNGGGTTSDHTNMLQVRKGDLTLHHCKQKVVALSLARSDVYEANMPTELVNSGNSDSWDRAGYRVDAEYYELEEPLDMSNKKEWLADNYYAGGPFRSTGNPSGSYLYPWGEKQVTYLLKLILKQQKSAELREFIKALLAEINDDSDPEYDSDEQNSIEEILEASGNEKPEWESTKEKQKVTTSSSTGRERPARDPQVAADSLAHAEYKCEYDNTDRTFIRKNGKPYTEPHHLIPISKYKDFEYSLDVMQNITSLCSHCHNLLHYGRFEDKKPILEKLYNERKDALHECGIDITIEQLESYYK